MSTHKKFLLIGYLGANNLGDECMLREFLKLVGHYTHISFIIDSYGINYDSERVTTHLISSSPSGRWEGYAEVLREVDGIIWVGGNCFTDFDGDGAFGLLMLAKRLRKRFYYFSVGTDKLTRVKRKIKTILALHLADGVLFRDTFSLLHAQKWHVKQQKLFIGSDLGERYLSEERDNYPCERREVVVSWRELKKNIPNQEDVIQRLAGYLAAFCTQREKRLVIFNSDEYMDKEVHALLMEHLAQQGFRNYHYYENTTLEEKLAIISKACCVITARLHTGMAAYLFNKPTILYNYSQKIIEFAQNKRLVMLLSNSMEELRDSAPFLDTTPDTVSMPEPDRDSDVYRAFVKKMLQE